MADGCRSIVPLVLKLTTGSALDVAPIAVDVSVQVTDGAVVKVVVRFMGYWVTMP